MMNGRKYTLSLYIHTSMTENKNTCTYTQIPKLFSDFLLANKMSACLKLKNQMEALQFLGLLTLIEKTGHFSDWLLYKYMCVSKLVYCFHAVTSRTQQQKLRRRPSIHTIPK